jgi:hypothetical protein
MPDAAYGFTIGPVRCAPVSDGSFPNHPGLFFANVPQPQWEQGLPAQGLRAGAVTLTYNCLLVSTGRNKVRQAAETRRRLLDRASADRTKLMAYHVPSSALGRAIARWPDGWQCEPAASVGGWIEDGDANP